MSTVTPDQQPRPAGKFTWRMLATVVGGQALVIFFGALTSRGLDPDQAPVVAGLTPFVLARRVTATDLRRAPELQRERMLTDPVLGLPRG